MVEINIEQAKQLLRDRWLTCTEEEKKEGLTWYLKAHDVALISSYKYGISLSKTAGVIASLSPKNKWSDNIKDANLVLFNFSQGRDTLQSEISSPFPKVSTSLEILKTDIDPYQRLGQKSRSFYRCIYCPVNISEVCIDSWAARAIHYTERWISKKNYPIIQQCYREVAKEVGLTPSAFQAIIWVNIRGKAN